jgi:hypothetical protein
LDRRFKIALVTDGRLSGASGKVPSAIHVTPEAYDGGLLAKVRDGDIIRVNGQTGELTLLVDEAELASRQPHIPDLSASRVGTGREMFSALRENSPVRNRAQPVSLFKTYFVDLARENSDEKLENKCRSNPDHWPGCTGYRGEQTGTRCADGKSAGCRRRARSGSDPAYRMCDGCDSRDRQRSSGRYRRCRYRTEPQQLAEVTEAGAQFAISPGLTEPLLKAATEGTIPLIPGISTVSELMLGMDYGLKEFKFFPAEANGGTKALQAIAGPFSQVRFCPTGGISPANYRDYLALKSVLCIGGSWLVPADALEAGDYDRITKLAREAVEGAKQ